MDALSPNPMNDRTALERELTLVLDAADTDSWYYQFVKFRRDDVRVLSPNCLAGACTEELEDSYRCRAISVPALCPEPLRSDMRATLQNWGREDGDKTPEGWLAFKTMWDLMKRMAMAKGPNERENSYRLHKYGCLFLVHVRNGNLTSAWENLQLYKETAHDVLEDALQETQDHECNTKNLLFKSPVAIHSTCVDTNENSFRVLCKYLKQKITAAEIQMFMLMNQPFRRAGIPRLIPALPRGEGRHITPAQRQWLQSTDWEAMIEEYENAQSDACQ